MTRLLRALTLLLLAATAIAPRVASAHEIRPAYLQIEEEAGGSYRILWRTPVLAGVPLPVALRLPESVRSLTAPSIQSLPDSLVERRWVDAGPEGLSGRRVTVDGLPATLTDVLVRIRLRDGAWTSTLMRPTQNWVEIGQPPSLAGTMARYLVTGIQHILHGPDHLLFILGLMALVASGRMLVKTITAFTVAHSITLALATFGVVTVSAPALEMLIALSILFLAPEILRQQNGGHSLTIGFPWIVAFAFGLLHGLGFATGLGAAGLPRDQILPALLAFNVGVEIGQLAFVGAVLLTLAALRSLRVAWPRPIRLAPAYLVGVLGAFWTCERIAAVVGGGA